MSNIKQKFIEDLIENLNEENSRRIYDNKNPIDICFIISVLDQQIENCKEFINDITKYKYYINKYKENLTGGYGNINILIEKPDEEKQSDHWVDKFYNFYYIIEFIDKEKMLGYCQCKPEDKGYNAKYGCCGTECDWYAPAFYIHKVIDLYSGAWQGYEKDFWKYKEQFEQNINYKNEKVERYKKEQKIKSIQKQMNVLQDKLEQLQCKGNTLVK